MSSKAIYQAGQAADELAMFPSSLADIQGPDATVADPSRMDPGLAWCESVRQHDPDHKIALDLFWTLDARAG